jgi:hypothetical protein
LVLTLSLITASLAYIAVRTAANQTTLVVVDKTGVRPAIVRFS